MESGAQKKEVLLDPLGTRDFSKPSIFKLTNNQPNKTIDIGHNGSSLSLDACGRVLQASTYHHDHGIVLASAFEQFDGARYYDVLYVRAYRTRMLQMMKDNHPGFGLSFGVGEQLVSIKIIETNLASYQIDLSDDVNLVVIAEVADNGSFVQHAKITNQGTKDIVLPYTYRVAVSLNRASYGQLTEGGPLPLPQSQSILWKSNPTTLCVQNPHLGTQLFASLEVKGKAFDFGTVREQETFASPLDVGLQNKICVPAGETASFCASFRLVSDLEHRTNVFRPSGPERLDQLLGHAHSHWKSDNLLSTYIIRRNVEYVLANCAVRISPTEVAIIADHVALPLGWNRDNHWQIHLLLETHANLDDLVHSKFEHIYKKKILSAARGHLEWVFNKAERPNGFWQRSYLVNGQPKDRTIFQLDQQCYPLLGLCDYLDYFPEEVEFVRNIVAKGVIQQILSALDSKKDPHTRLWLTDETPGDDAVVYPHHFSSHVLLWRTYTRLHRLFARAGLLQGSQRLQLDAIAAGIKTRTIESFAAQHPKTGKRMFAYLTDGHGNSTFYHDANDVPTYFAKEWGFVSTPEEVAIWTATMEFGLSPTNETGYCNDGLYGGLGSVHSPGAWTLGYFQELAYAASMNNSPAIQAAWTKIAAAMNWDGTFSEAVDAKTAKCTSKAWFSWPGSMIGAQLIQMRMNGQEKVLVAGKR